MCGVALTIGQTEDCMDNVLYQKVVSLFMDQRCSQWWPIDEGHRDLSTSRKPEEAVTLIPYA